jgi:putative peptidoglycan lipid II flippase
MKTDFTTKDSRKPYSLSIVLWVVFYCYTTFTALIFQKLLLPMFPAFHGGKGLINADSLIFHNVAVSLAESIRLHGWGAWTLWPATGVTGNVGILGALYALFGDDPALIIPVNALLHATSGVIIYLTGRKLFPNRIGLFSGVIASVLFVVYPSSLNWYAQIHKDGYVILGMLIILYSWITGIVDTPKLRSVIVLFSGTIFGMLLNLLVRPYNIKLLIVSSSCIFIVILVWHIFSREISQKKHLLVYFFLIVVMLSVTLLFIPKASLEDKELFSDKEILWTWKKSGWVPEKLEHQIESAATIRVHNILNGKKVEAKSIVDENVMPDNIKGVIVYIPRALEIALLGPFPKDWFNSSNITHIVAALETSIWYFLIPGCFLLLYFTRSLPVYIIITNSFVFLAIYGFTLPNLGTIYRLRYVYIFLLMILGIAGWLTFFVKRYSLWPLSKDRKPVDSARSYNVPESSVPFSAVKRSRIDLTSAGILVVIWAALSNLLFFVRDILVARWFGLSSELDIFFIAMIIPTFLVTVLSMPLGTAIVSPFLQIAKNNSLARAKEYITSTTTALFLLMIAVCVMLYLSADGLMSVVGWGFSIEKIEKAKHVLILLIPIFLCSGFLIIGNSILNALGKYSTPSLAQISVPIVAILVLLVFEKYIGIYALALGMLAGQLINFWIVHLLAKREGFSLMPQLGSNMFGVIKKSSEQLKVLWSQYAPLVLSALFMSLAVPINNMIAATLENGSISALNLGSKFVLFFTGTIGVGISTVMLPYFSSHFVGKRLIDMRRELSFFLFLSTIVTIIASVFLFIIIESVIRIAFQGGLFTSDNVKTVARVVEYGIIQLPFFAVNVLFSRYATANQKNNLVMFTSLFGLVVNICLNFLFIKHMGVAGIALASTLSMLLSTMLFIIIGHRINDILWIDIVMIVLTWVLFLTLILCFHYRSYSGVFISASTLVLVMAQHFRFFLRGFERLD